MIDKVNTWLLVVAALIGLGTVSATAILVSEANHRTDREVCQVKEQGNAQTRKLIADLLANPQTSAATKTFVEGITLKDEPIKVC